MKTKSSFKILIILSLVITGCVSIDLNKVKDSKSDKVKFDPPPASYEPVKDASADQAWRNKKNGNSISFVSSCYDPAEPSLESLNKITLSGIPQQEEILNERIDYNGRGALRTQTKGNVDGIGVIIENMVFKKNNCSYVISYVGVGKNFEKDRKYYDEFLSNFKVQ